MTKIVGVGNIYRVLAACAYNANIRDQAPGGPAGTRGESDLEIRSGSFGRRISATKAKVLRLGQSGRGMRERGHWEGDRLCIRAHGSEGWSLDTGGGL
jgi:hypothetical protein